MSVVNDIYFPIQIN